jgi:transcriptional regulator with XRE-family HTH domain
MNNQATIGHCQEPGTNGHAPMRGKLHRIQEVRQLEGLTLRTVATRMNTGIREVKAQESASADISLSVLYRWQQALGVPASELLAESNGVLSEPIRQRACMVRLAKTALTLLEKASNDSTRRLAQAVVNQCIEIMPELQHVTPWPERGNSRTTNRLGRTVEQPIPDVFRLHELLCDE